MPAVVAAPKRSCGICTAFQASSHLPRSSSTDQSKQWVIGIDPWPIDPSDAWPMTHHKHTTPRSIIRVIHVNDKCMSTAHFTDKYLVLCTLRNSLLRELWVFSVIQLRLPSVVQRVIHWYGILPLLHAEISLSTNFREYLLWTSVYILLWLAGLMK